MYWTMKYLLLTQLLIFCCYSCDSLFIQSRKTVDFRSDTLTKPTNAMRSAMFEAEVGDDVFQEDPTVLKLENRVAQMLNKDSALFFPSGTMSNLCGAMVWCTSRGSEMILGSKSHIFVYEQGGTAQFGGIFPHILPNEDDGSINIHAIEHAIRENNIHYPKTELICIENTHNVCGGRVLSLNYLEQLSRLSSQYQIPIHMDGARVWNAAASLNIDVKEISRYADSLSVCLSKGLGAPVGSLLVGDKLYIEKARRLRKALGGGMRQAGVIAAAGMIALNDFENGILSKDHELTRLLGRELNKLSLFNVDVNGIDSNIIFVQIVHPTVVAEELTKHFKENGILVLSKGLKSFRVVVHRDLNHDDILYAIDIFRNISIAYEKSAANQEISLHDDATRVKEDIEMIASFDNGST